MRVLLGIVLTALAAFPQSPQKLEITVEKRESGAWKVMDPGHVFQEGDQLRFRFKSDQPGFLYVVNLGSSGEQVTLFPSDQAGMDNQITPGQEYMIPSTDGAFRITGPKGYDTVYWVMSPVRIGEPTRYRPLPRPPSPGKVPLSLQPRCDDTILNARGECVDPGAGLRPNRNPNLVARELFFIRKGEQSIVSVPPPADSNVAAEPINYVFRIAHQ
jgi:hypothetical protein